MAPVVWTESGPATISELTLTRAHFRNLELAAHQQQLPIRIEIARSAGAKGDRLQVESLRMRRSLNDHGGNTYSASPGEPDVS